MAIVIKEMRVKATVERTPGPGQYPADQLTMSRLTRELSRKIRQEIRREFEKREGR